MYKFRVGTKEADFDKTKTKKKTNSCYNNVTYFRTLLLFKIPEISVYESKEQCWTWSIALTASVIRKSSDILGVFHSEAGLLILHCLSKIMIYFSEDFI